MNLVRTANDILLVDVAYYNDITHKYYTNQTGTECEILEYVSDETSIKDLKELISKYEIQ